MNELFRITDIMRRRSGIPSDPHSQRMHDGYWVYRTNEDLRRLDSVVQIGWLVTGMPVWMVYAFDQQAGSRGEVVSTTPVIDYRVERAGVWFKTSNSEYFLTRIEDAEVVKIV